MSNIISTSKLNYPAIQGTVEVNLADLDKMRNEHTTAVTLAKHLEEQQSKVVLIVKKLIQGAREVQIGKDRNGIPQYKFEEYQDYQIISTTYINLDEVETEIKKEQFELLKNQIKTSNENLEKAVIIKQNVVNEYNKLQEEFKENKSLLVKAEKEIKQNLEFSEKIKLQLEEKDSKINSYLEHIKDLEKIIANLKNKKSFWNFFNK